MREHRGGHVPSPRIESDLAFAHDPAGDIRLLTALARALNGAADVPQALTQTLRLVTAWLHLPAGWVWLRDPATGRFYNAAAYHLPPYLRDPLQMTGTPCWCLGALQDRTLTPRDIAVRACGRLHAAWEVGAAAEATAGLRYHASIPLVVGDTPLGLMNVAAVERRALTGTERGLLAAVGYQVGGVVDRTRLAEERLRLVRAEERARIAREIHDTLAQGLTAIALHVESALPHLEGDPGRARARLTRALDTTHASLEEARRSVLNLRAGPPAGTSLVEALGAMGRAVTAETGVRVHVDAPRTEPLPLPVEAELFRIAQQAMANIRAHARAHEVTVSLRRRGHRVSLSIRDDGCGFDPSTVGPGRHGLVGMRERATLAGGRLRVWSRPGGGTTITASVPLAPEGEA
jgi:two-component system NarL family sensor kinase